MIRSRRCGFVAAILVSLAVRAEKDDDHNQCNQKPICSRVGLLEQRVQAQQQTIDALLLQIHALSSKLAGTNLCAPSESPVCCPGGDTFCPANGCTPLSSDVNNCGACGNACGARGDGCSASACTCGGGSGCATGSACFSGKCVTCGLVAAAAMPSCKAILNTCPGLPSGPYWVNPDNTTAVRVWCDMTTDGGGFTVCARQSFASDGNYLGNTLLTTVVGSPDTASSPFGADCVDLMVRTRPGGFVEFGLQGSTAGEWQWVWPFSTQNFFDHLKGSDGTQCDGGAISECRGSATGGSVAVNKLAACHSYSPHRTSDFYFIYQVASGQNSDVLMEIGQGDQNHPVGIRADCNGSGWWGSCGNPGGTNYPYAIPSECGSNNRLQGVAGVMFRER